MARKKKELFSIEGHPWNIESTPWGQEAEHERLYDQASPFELFSLGKCLG